MEEFLAQAAGDGVEVGHARNFAQPELAIGRDHQMNRTLDLGGVGRRAVKVARQKDGPQQTANIVAVSLKAFAQLGDQLDRRVVVHEIAVQLGGDEAGGDLLLQDDVDNLHPVKIAAASQKGLVAVVVQLGFDHKAQAVIRPAGERAGRLADVGLGIISDAHGEQLQDFPTEVFVGAALDIFSGVQVHQHGRVPGHANQQIAKAATAVFVEQGQLVERFAVVAQLGIRGGEMPVPEQGQLFLQRSPGGQHPVGPPLGRPTHFQIVRPQPVKEAVDYRLERSVATRLDCDAHGFAVCPGNPHGVDPTLGKRLNRGIEDVGFVKRGQVVVGNGVIVDQPFDRLPWCQGGQLIDLLGRAAKAGSLQQVGRPVAAPGVRRDRPQVSGPVGRTGPPVGHGRRQRSPCLPHQEGQQNTRRPPDRRESETAQQTGLTSQHGFQHATIMHRPQSGVQMCALTWHSF